MDVLLRRDLWSTLQLGALGAAICLLAAIVIGVV